MMRLFARISYHIFAFYARKALCGKQLQNRVFAGHRAVRGTAHSSFVKSFFVPSGPPAGEKVTSTFLKGGCHLFQC